MDVSPPRRTLLAISVVLLLGVGPALHAINISVIGSWSRAVGELDLVAGGGSDLTFSYESAVDQGLVDITGAGQATWRVDVKRSDTTWHNDLSLEVQRTSDGSGPGSISGGTTYIEVTTIDMEFYSGDRSRQNVDVQLKISGVSVSLGIGSFSTTVTYTVTTP